MLEQRTVHKHDSWYGNCFDAETMLLQLSSRRSTQPTTLVALLSECHQRIRHFSHLACELARRSDAPPAEIEQAAASVMRYFSEALPLHVADEEESITPRLRGRSDEVTRALTTMSQEHVEHGPQLAELLSALTELRQAPTSEQARLRLAAVAMPLQLDFERHLALEESVLFPALHLLPAADQKQIVEELRARRAN